ncbi:nucleoside hydrolase [Microbacterium sp. NPDC019599]|uniref:nucleoside hydrolase n=1 Tax=Microbacterium sp. NPDC019599 TaxID=3154690 RepID=UPI0033DB014D
MPDSSPVPLYLDCDTGIDDALALAYLLASSHARLVGIGTVSGNIDAATAAINTANLLGLAGRGEVQIFLGEQNFRTHPYAGGAPEVHGSNGIGGVALPSQGWTPPVEAAAEALVRLAHECEGRLRVLAIGPLTNLARALELDPGLPGLVHSVTIMGGAGWVDGNITPFAEANVANDPEAAQIVLNAGWPILLVPLDVTRAHRFDVTHQAALRNAGSAVHTALGEMLDTYLDFYEPILGVRQCILYDPLAAALALGDLTITDASLCKVSVDVTGGPERGRTVCSDVEQGMSVSHVRVVRAVAEDAAPHLLERMLSIRA